MNETILFVGVILFLAFLYKKYEGRQFYTYPISERDKHVSTVLKSPNPNRVLDPKSYLVPGFYTHGYYFDIKDENKRWEDWTYGQKYAKISA